MRLTTYSQRSSLAFVSTLILAFFLIVPCNAALVINEFMASNGTTVTDPQGHYDDWIEIYNPGPGTADLGGMYRFFADLSRVMSVTDQTVVAGLDGQDSLWATGRRNPRKHRRLLCCPSASHQG